MHKVVTNTVRTLVFCLSSATTKSRLHFFPAAGVSTGPYPIICKLTLFGKGVERKSVMLDGGRLGQPDGLRVEDAFPALRGDIAGMFGIEVELSCPQQTRLNLLSSQCWVELVSQQFSVQYLCAPFVPTAVDIADVSGYSHTSEVIASVYRRPRVLLGLHDGDVATSLVVVNSETENLRPDLFKVLRNQVVTLQVGTVTGEGAVEIALDEFLFKESSPQELSWGLVRAEGIHMNEIPTNGVSYYMMYRESSSRKPLTVCAL